MSPRARNRLLALGLSGAFSLLLGWGLWQWKGEPLQHLIFHEPDIDAIAHERAATYAPGEVTGVPTAVTDPATLRYYLTEDHAVRLYGLRPKDQRRYDPWCGYSARPGRYRKTTWEEHPDGFWYSQTNSEGLTDRDLDREAEFDLKVLAGGDSHSFGLCNIDENWASQLEVQLGERWPERSFEVLNTSQGGFTFYNYVGMLEKYLDWDPDVFVLGVFAGNDFSELLGMAHVFGEGERPRLGPEPSERRRYASKNISRSAMGQCFSSVFTFHTKPEWIDIAMERSLDLIGQMKEICDRRDMLFVVVVIPAPCEFEWGEPFPEFEEMRKYLQLSAEDCAVADRMVDRFFSELSELGVVTVDLRDRFAAQPEPPYWRKDLHINILGHRLLAEEVLPAVADWAVESGRIRSSD